MRTRRPTTRANFNAQWIEETVFYECETLHQPLMSGNVWASFSYEHLRRWLAVFPGDEIMLVDNAEFLADTPKMMASIAHHIGLDPNRWEGGALFAPMAVTVASDAVGTSRLTKEDLYDAVTMRALDVIFAPDLHRLQSLPFFQVAL